MARVDKPVVQAYVELRAHDPEAVSALHVSQRTLAAGAGLRRLRRWRLVELRGTLLPPDELADLLHRSTQFYNPGKERCVVRADATSPAPVAADEQALLVVERGAERRPAAERWWRHQTGERVEVREGLVWGLQFEPGVDAVACARALALSTDRRHGLFANPHAQDCKLAEAAPPLPWIPGRTGRIAVRVRRRSA